MIFRFDDFEADEDRFELRHRGRSIPIQSRVLETILFLARRPGRLVTKDDLVAGPWSGTTVSAGALNQALMLARRALKGASAQASIVTVRGKGIRFDARVEQWPADV
jgi:DNA-binding winged helix-turn-helix (wHTH) protein